MAVSGVSRDDATSPSVYLSVLDDKALADLLPESAPASSPIKPPRNASLVQITLINVRGMLHAIKKIHIIYTNSWQLKGASLTQRRSSSPSLFPALGDQVLNDVCTRLMYEGKGAAMLLNGIVATSCRPLIKHRVDDDFGYFCSVRPVHGLSHTGECN